MLSSLGRLASQDEDPFRLLRLFVALLLGLGTVVALALWWSGIAPRALLLAGMFWALYGFLMALIDGVLEPVVDFAAQALQNVGLPPLADRYSAIEALVARGLYLPAADDYLARAQAGRGDTEAMVRRARLLAGPLDSPGMAVAELANWRETRRLSAAEDIRVGLVLADLHDHRLGDPGHAMVELRRLLDLHPGARGMRRVKGLLQGFRAERFGPTESAG
jgi:hypothetical protein